MSSVNADVSVIIPCYKCADTIGRAVKSVVCQSLQVLEIILIDDYSKDLTCHELYKIKGHHPDGFIKVVELEENCGPATARNVGWDISRGKYIAFLDADDTWDSKKIQIQYLFMHDAGAAMSATSSRPFKSGNKEKKSVSVVYNNSVFRVGVIKMLFKNFIPTRTVMLKKDLAFRFEDGGRYAEDYLLWMKILYSRVDCYFIDECLAYTHDENKNHNRLSCNLKEMKNGVIEVYKYLHAQDKISFPLYSIVLFFSYMKYLRRAFGKVLYERSFWN